MPGPDELPFEDDDFDPDALLWSPGIDYVGGWRDATEAASELSEALEAVGIDLSTAAMRADASPTGAGVLRITLSPPTARRLAALARDAAHRFARQARVRTSARSNARRSANTALQPRTRADHRPSENETRTLPDPSQALTQMTRSQTVSSTAMADRTGAASSSVSAHEDAGGTGAPEPSGRIWAITTTDGCTAWGYLPAWAETDPSAAGVSLAELPIRLSDMSHRAPFPGQCVPVTCDDGPAEDTEIFWGSIDCNPHLGAPELSTPVVNIRIIDDYWLNDLDPNGVADLAAQLRAQADRLDNEVRPRLIAARADWNAHHPV